MGDGQNVRDGSSDDSFTGSNPIFQGNQVRGVAGQVGSIVTECFKNIVFLRQIYQSSLVKQNIFDRPVQN